jgi:hypothetical protein
MPDSLPDFLSGFFWDCDFTALSLKAQRDFIIRRLLQEGSWDALTWLRDKIGDAELRHWIESHHGGGLSSRQLRFWQAVLNLPPQNVNRWVCANASRPWEKRNAP